MLALMVRASMGSAPLVMVIFALPAPTGVRVTLVPSTLTVTTAGLLELALKLSALPSACFAVMASTSGASPASALYAGAPGVTVSCTGLRRGSPTRTSSIMNDLLAV